MLGSACFLHQRLSENKKGTGLGQEVEECYLTGLFRIRRV